jgi:hypothetical protein
MMMIAIELVKRMYVRRKKEDCRRNASRILREEKS